MNSCTVGKKFYILASLTSIEQNRSTKSLRCRQNPKFGYTTLMVILVSDVHLGRGGHHTDPGAERDLVHLLAFAAKNGAKVYFLGDLFEQFIEYRHLIPKGATRLLGALAYHADAGLEIRYIVGNRDPWHLNYFESELGISVFFDYLIESFFGKKVFLTHGDLFESSKGLYRFLRPILRHPLPTTLYKNLLPGDSGFALARRFSLLKLSNQTQPKTVNALRTAAQNLLKQHQCDLVVMGHSHKTELKVFEQGLYLNTGFWYKNRTFAVLTTDEVSLNAWKNGAVERLTTYHQQNVNNI